MSCKAGNKAHKDRCKRYEQEGRRAKNKLIKQERHLKRIEKFKKRREDGKTYCYKPNPYKKGSNEYIEEQNRRRQKNKNRKTQIEIWDSVMRKVNNAVEKEINNMKLKQERDKNG